MSHACPRPGCPRRVRDNLFACKDHWWGLPQPIRKAIWEAYDKHGVGTSQLAAAHAKATRYWRDDDKAPRGATG